MAAPDQAVDPFVHSEPWSEHEWLALETDARPELVDGLLVMSPRASNPHQRLAYRLWGALDAAAPEGWDVLGEPNVRLGCDRVLIPDVAVIARADMSATVNDAVDVDLVVEVVSLGNAAYDRLLKPRLYAEAGIRWYVRVERGDEHPVGHLHELGGAAYREVAVGTVLDLVEPFGVRLDLARLAR